MIPKSVPAKYRKHIQNWDDERNIDNGIIVTVKGLCDDPMMPCHVFGEDSVKEVVSHLRDMYPCQCEQCQ